MDGSRRLIGRVSSGTVVVEVYEGGIVRIIAQRPNAAVEEINAPGWAVQALGSLVDLQDVLQMIGEAQRS
ncbi:MAG: hypothetical protein M3R24_16265 [Chloroflexota bacterium]|nr:hypothetical protein [Chloroflexota bacterium]